MIRHAWILAAALILGAVGCQTPEPEEFVSSQQVLDLPEELQQQIRDVLREQCGPLSDLRMLGNPDATPSLKLGAEVYRRRCVQCHGASGDGNGPAAQYLDPLPRDYRRGIYKFTSTRWGQKPRRVDLVRVLRRGVTGTAMPAFDQLPDAEINAVVDYILALTHRGELEYELADIASLDGEIDPELVPELIDGILEKWKDAESQIVMPKTVMPEITPQSIEKGQALFVGTKAACVKCHGKNARGGVRNNLEVTKDAWGTKTFAADLSSGMFRGGGRPIDIYRRIQNGITGSPMPGSGDNLTEEEIWQIVHFVKTKAEERRRSLSNDKPKSAQETGDE